MNQPILTYRSQWSNIKLSPHAPRVFLHLLFAGCFAVLAVQHAAAQSLPSSNGIEGNRIEGKGAEGKAESSQPQTQPSASGLPPSLRIVKLLWNAQPKGAASALEKAMEQSLTRGEVQALLPGLQLLSEPFQTAIARGAGDVRYCASLAALILLNDSAALASVKPLLMQLDDQSPLSLAQKQLLLRCWLSAEPTQSHESISAMLLTVQLSGQPTTDAQASHAMQSLWLETVATLSLQTDRERTAKVILQRWRDWPRSMQIALIEPLSQQPATMKQLIAAIESGAVAKDLLNTNQLRKWYAGQDVELIAAMERVWGKLRTTVDEDRKAVVEQTMKLLAGGRSGHPTAGEQTFRRICIQCHRLHGEGFDVGPDITNNGRGSFEQLVSNVMDPSLVIGKAFLAKTVLTQDGRVLAGVVAAEDDRRLTLKIQGGQLVELNREDDIDEVKESQKSLMPDGLEKQMSEQELLDLFAYLSLARPLASADNDLIPGTPPSLLK